MKNAKKTIRPTAAQAIRARKEHRARVDACRRIGVDGPSFLQILTEIVNSPAGALDLPAMTRADFREGAVFQSYRQYQPPKDLKGE